MISSNLRLPLSADRCQSQGTGQGQVFLVGLTLLCALVPLCPDLLAHLRFIKPNLEILPTDAQVDVVAVNWRERAILLGECEWGVKAVRRSVIGELVKEAPRVVPGEGWRVHCAFFAHAGFTASGSLLAHVQPRQQPDRTAQERTPGDAATLPKTVPKHLGSQV